jgi:hemoglobin-like flavoprotein
MTPEQQALVRESWRRFQPSLRETGNRFYEQLFALNPSVQRLFAATDMEQQERKLMAMLGEIVRALDEPVELVPELAALGRRHVHYGVADGDYDSVGSALLWTRVRGLGEVFTPEVRAAWTEAYLLVSTIMRRAAGREPG